MRTPSRFTAPASPRSPRMLPLFVALLALMTVLPACRREQPQAPAAQAPVATPPASAPAVPAASPALKDVAEHTPDYIIGISYPAVAAQYPALAVQLQRYADEARAELMQAVQGRGKDAGAPYELVLPFSELHVDPALVVVGVDGSSYTGGAHGAPLIGRWVWLPQQQRLLTAQDLVADAKGWEAVAGLVREQLHTALSQRVDADELAPGERVEVLKGASKMIEDGTQPDPTHFSQFEPVVGSNGRIRALRFVFPPYQVGPYSDGTQTVEVPAAALLPHVAPQFRDLFEGA